MRRMLGWVLLLGAHVAMADPRAAAVRVYSFPAGPTLLLAPDSLAGSAHVGVWYEAGSRNDPRGAAGLAYVLERSALDLSAETQRTLAQAGASFDRTVTPDVSASSVTLSAEQLGPVLGAVLPVVAAPSLTDDALRSGVEGARAERVRRVAQTPLLPGIERVCAALFPDQGYAAPSSGRDEDLASISPEAARQDLAARFAPAHALVTVTGRFDPAEALAAMQVRFGTPAPAAGPAKFEPPAFGAVEPRVNAGASTLPVPVVLVGWRLPPDRDPDSAALEVLARLLTGGANARIERALVTGEGPFLQTQGTFERRRDAGLLVVAAAVQGKVDTVQIESKLVAEVERYGKEPLTAADLEPARNAEQADVLLRAQEPGARAEALATAQLVDGDWRAWDARVARIRAVTPADVQRAAARWLVPANRAAIWMDSAPQKPGDQP